MPAAPKPERIEIGFSGGQVIAARLTAARIKELRKALDGDGWTDIETEEGNLAIDASHVVFVRYGDSEHQVGFAG